jgi:WD repeat-containing protein 6
MVLFPLLKNLVLGTSVAQEMKIPPVNHFKGVHGISSVSSVVVTKLGYNQIEIRSVCLTIHPSNWDKIGYNQIQIQI